MIIGVTGASGFVGRHLIDALVARGNRPRALLRDRDQLPFANPSAVDSVIGSLADHDALTRLAAGADAIIHLVGIIVERRGATFNAIHVDGTRAVVAAARAARVRRFVHMSAAGARDTSDATPYHRTKARAESIVRDSALPHVIFRPTFISGQGNVPIRTLARLHRFAPVVPLFGDGSFPMQPVWIGDVVTAFALAAEGQSPEGMFEIGGPSVMPYSEFVRAIGRASGRPRPVIHVPLRLVRLAARVFDLLGPAAPLTSDQLQMLVEGSTTGHNSLQSVFGIEPLDFEVGLRRFLGN